MNTPLPLLVLHDFDKSGFTILGIFNRATRRYAYENKLLVIDLGLRLDEATTMGLQTENVIVTGKHPEKNLKANGATRKEINFLLSGRAQRTKRGVPGQRVELNAMTSDQMVPWLERKIREAGIEKVIPPNEVIEAGYRQLLAQKKLHGVIKAAIPGIERQVQRLPLPSGLVKNVKARLKANPELPWDAALAAEAYEANL
jgi:hypothetical protein